ncbi:MAG: Hsp20/alpha crystallin family protein [Chitinophagaceae bacterium]|nr:Hsp20/alpha crystallin family protein [Chitinophagaceae bacterium]
MTHVKFNNRPVVRSYDSFFNDFFNLPTTWGTTASDSGAVSANVSETPQAYHLDLNVPGRNKEDFKINIEKDLLTISYEKKEEQKEEGVNSVRREFNFNSFKRSFSLDERIDAGNIQAKYENGILKIELPKKEQVKEEPKTIAIN